MPASAIFTSSSLFAFVSAIFFGLALVLTQFGLRWLSPMRGAAVGIPTTAVVFLAIAPFAIDWPGWDIRAVAVFAAVGCLFPAIVTVLTFQANHRIGPNMTGALGNLAPVFAVDFAAIMLGELPRPWQVAGLVVIVLGVTILIATRGGAGGIGSVWPLWAPGLPLVAALIRGMVQPAVKFGFVFWPDPFAAALIGYLISAMLVSAVVFARERMGPFVGDPRGRLWFAAVGLCNGAAVLAMYAALRSGDVALVAPLIACYPLASLCFSALFLGNVRLHRRLVLGVVVTVIGVALLLTARN